MRKFDKTRYVYCVNRNKQVIYRCASVPQLYSFMMGEQNLDVVSWFQVDKFLSADWELEIIG